MRKTFTLIELLVVIVIIAILASMLLPVLNQSRERARSTSCMSKIKQLAFGFSSYAASNNDMYPSLNNNGGTIGYNAAMWYTPILAQLGITGIPGSSTEFRLPMLECPSDQYNNTYVVWNNKISFGYNGFYFANNYRSRGGSFGTGSKATKVKFPSKTLIVSDRGNNDLIGIDTRSDGVVCYEADKLGNQPAKRHAKGANCGFPDGHAKAVTFAELTYKNSNTSVPINRYFGYSYQPPSRLTGE